MDREILLLREFDQLSYAEIADLLGLPLNTVRSRLFRARTALPNLLEPPAASAAQDAPQNVAKKGTRMSTTTHPFTPEEVMAFVDGELAADRAQSVSNHIEQCAECRELIGSLRYTSHSLSSWTVPVAPSSEQFEKRLAGSVSKAQSSKEFSLGVSFRTPLGRRWLLAVASAGLVVLVLGIAPARLQRSRRMRERQSSEVRSTFGKLDALAAAASPIATPAVRAGDVGVSVDFAEVNVRPGAPLIARTVSLSILQRVVTNATGDRQVAQAPEFRPG